MLFLILANNVPTDPGANAPWAFIADLIDIYPMKVATAAKTCCKRLKNPPKSINEYLEILLKQGLTVTTSLLRQYCYEV